MKVEVLRLIEDALIGGKHQGNGVWIENNPFILQLFQESKKDFKEFLFDCINGIKEEEKQKTTEYIIKRVNVDKAPEELSYYKKKLNEKNEADYNLNKALDNLAEKLNPLLKEISTYKLESRQYDTYVEFRILPTSLKD